MNALNLYSSIEQNLDFTNEISKLYDAYILLINQLEINSIIDIGCGQGDFLLQLQNENIRTFGIDLSSEQIKICKSKNINSSCINVCDVNEKFNVASAMFDVLNYINKDDLKNFISCTYDVLEDNGYFIFDVNSLFGFEEVAQGSLNINKEDKFIAIDAYFEENILKTSICVFDKKTDDNYQKQEDTIFQYYHKKDFLKSLLINSGFKIENIINFKLHDTNEADKFIFVCKKINK